ncbi:F-box/kelch-repeat protein At3g06240-like [Nicotiana tabacum]|uniref:F-box/kelch-repeat protein At3g06240-like n=1 Tax=Nicotiana tabacum TaxID=4097 RepID=A0A1S4AGX8_TOBAC|nr:PREDICTED: F-box/kelch-repeat protein At3g06240-like [Nicotiana tabacum]
MSGFYNIHSCCDGLVLLGINYPRDYILWLWNPSTRESIVLPQENFIQDHLYGLGYDSTTDDYKVLKVPLGDDDAPNEIFALKSGYWRELESGCCSFSEGMNCLAFVQGAFHWISSYSTWTWVDGNMHILLVVKSFDISNEVYLDLPIPKVSRFGMTGLGVTELGGMLNIRCVYNRYGTTSFDLWVMKEYGVEASWTELFCIGDTTVPSIIPILPKYMFADGELLLSCKEGTVFRTSKGPHGISALVWPLVGDDSDENTFLLMDGLAYTESLISPVVNH